MFFRTVAWRHHVFQHTASHLPLGGHDRLLLHLPTPAIFATFPYNYFTIMHQTRYVPSLCCLAMMELIFKYTDSEKKEKPHHLDRQVKMFINPIPDGY